MITSDFAAHPSWVLPAAAFDQLALILRQFLRNRYLEKNFVLKLFVSISLKDAYGQAVWLGFPRLPLEQCEHDHSTVRTIGLASDQAIDIVAQRTIPASPLECHANTHADRVIALK